MNRTSMWTWIVIAGFAIISIALWQLRRGSDSGLLPRQRSPEAVDSLTDKDDGRLDRTDDFHHEGRLLIKSDVVTVALALSEYRALFHSLPHGDSAQISMQLHGNNPSNIAIMRTTARSASGLFRDGWKTPYEIKISDNKVAVLSSAGANRSFGDSDDESATALIPDIPPSQRSHTGDNDPYRGATTPGPSAKIDTPRPETKTGGPASAPLP